MLYDLRGCDKGVALRIRETNMPFHESLEGGVFGWAPGPQFAVL